MGVFILLAAALVLLWYLLGPRLKALRKKEASLTKRKAIPGSAQPGKAVTLVLTDVESSTELWCVNLFQMCMGACCD
jgi:class 3 adenylate cyclase